MTLREELPQRTQDHGFTRINNDLHDEIESQIQVFLKSGGKINEVLPGVSGDLEAPLKEKNAIDRMKKMAFDRARLKEHHAKGEMLHIKYLPACKTKEARFRFCHHAKVMGYFPTLDEAIGFKVKA